MDILSLFGTLLTILGRKHFLREMSGSVGMMTGNVGKCRNDDGKCREMSGNCREMSGNVGK